MKDGVKFYVLGVSVQNRVFQNLTLKTVFTQEA